MNLFTYCFSVIKSSKCSCCHSVTKSCLILCDLMNCSSSGFPVLHCLPEFAQTHVHWVDDAIQPSHPLSSPSPAFNLSQHQSFSSESALASGGHSIGASASALVLPMNIEGWFPLGLTDPLAVVIPILLFYSISLHCSLKKAFLFLLAIDYKKFWFWLNLA